MKLDYQLRHQLFGRQGSLWEKQVDAETRTRIRRLVKSAGNAAVLSELDQIASAALNEEKVLAEDRYFTFIDGSFAVVGRHQRDYTFRQAQDADGNDIYAAYRDDPAEQSTSVLKTKIADVTDDFIARATAGTSGLSVDRDWYIVPIPRDMSPIAIEARDSEFLVQGVDFLNGDGYIAMTDNPAEVLPLGMVQIVSGYQDTPSPNAYVMSAGKFVADYSKKSQSVSAFRKAAAEFAGLYVVKEPDMVLDARDLGNGTHVYNLANAGPVAIDYPHKQLAAHTSLTPGTVICDRFDVLATEYNSATNIKELLSTDWGHPIKLDGILPVNGLTWDGEDVSIDSVADDPTSGTAHVRLKFSGDAAVLERFWEFSRLHEARTQEFLFDALGGPTLPNTVDFWDYLETFYGSQLLLILASHHTPRINTRLWRFVTENKPQACNSLLSIDMNVDLSTIRTDDQGIPALDDNGSYVLL